MTYLSSYFIDGMMYDVKDINRAGHAHKNRDCIPLSYVEKRKLKVYFKSLKETKGSLGFPLLECL